MLCHSVFYKIKEARELNLGDILLQTYLFS